MAPIFIAMGNPLLDMQVTNGEALLEKYGLKPNDAILAEGKQNEIYGDLEANHQITYVAGGAAQNAARAAQYVLPEGSTAYFGAVGADSLADQLRAANDKEGLVSAYQVVDDKPTGACAVVITGHHRSLCTTLGAAESFSASHLAKPEQQKLIDEAKFFYLGGFFLTHGLESALILAKQANEAGKPFSMNLSAPFIPQFFKSQVDEILPYVDILIGNESEAIAYAESHEWGTTDIAEIALKLSQGDKKGPKPRVVVITQGADSTITATEGKAKVHPVAKLAAEQIVDTNGAGDMFAGAFLGSIAAGKALDAAIEVGHKAGAMSVGLVGPQLAWPKQSLA